MKKLLLLLISLLTLSATKQTNAQGTACGSAIDLDGLSCYANAYSLSPSSTVKYFKFTATDNFVKIIVKDYTDVSENHAGRVSLLRNPCGAGNYVATENYVLVSDSTITLYAPVILDTVYYLVINNEVINNPAAANTFGMCLNFQNVAAACDTSSTYCELARNGTFEGYNTCPTAPTQGQGYPYAKCWTNPSTGNFQCAGLFATPDYMNTCATAASQVDIPANYWGSQGTHGGNGYAGLYVYSQYQSPQNGSFSLVREYLEEQLKAPMVAGKTYFCEFYVSLSGKSSFATDSIGMYITQGAVSQNCGDSIWGVQPQIRAHSFITDTTNWTQISGYYTAVGGEDHITIGGFNDTSLTAVPVAHPFGHPASYYYIDDVSVVESPQINISPNSTLCQGNSTFLYAHGGGTYVWTPSTGLNNANIWNPIATPSVTTTYHVTVTNGLCSSTDSVTITVVPYPTAVGLSDTTVCQGTSVQLNCTPNNVGLYTYQWSPAYGLSCTTCPNPVATPNTTTTYSVIIAPIAGPSCSDTAQVTVTINQRPAAQTITGPTTVCSPASSTYCVPNTFSAYSWVLAAGGGASITSGAGTSCIVINFGTATQADVKCVVTDANGCVSDTAYYHVANCCKGPTTGGGTPKINILNGGNASTVFGGATTISNSRIWLDGTLNIDQNMTFKGDTFTMGYNAKIIVNASKVLTITSSASNGNPTYIHSCDYMWDGIYVTNSGAKINILSNVLIEDAINGIVIQNNNGYRIAGDDSTNHYVRFNKNLRSVQISNYSVADTSKIWSTGFFSNPSVGLYTYGAGHLLRPPYATYYSLSGIEVSSSSVSNTIGDATKLKWNRFEYLHVGIKCTNTTTTVTNSRFKDILYTSLCMAQYPNPCPPDGVAIYGSGTAGVYQTLHVGVGRGCTFTNCFSGVVTENQMNAHVIFNVFDMNVVGNSPGRGVYVNNVKNGSAVISYNNFIKFKTAIQTRWTDTTYIAIGNNYIYNNSSNVANSRGIVVQDGFTAGGGNAYILYNQINNVQTGILAGNIHGDNFIYMDRLIIANNDIKFTSANLPASGMIYGIRLQNCSYGLVTEDSIYCTAASTLTGRFFGISQESSSNIYTYSHNIKNIGTGERYYLNNFPSVFKCNTMTHCNYGVMQEASTIGQQGTSGAASDNQWKYRYVGNNDILFTSQPETPKWFYRSSPAAYVPVYLSNAINPQAGATPSASCTVNITGPYKQQNLAMVAREDIVYPEHTYENTSMAAQNAYRQLKMDTVLIHQTTAEDALLTHYRDSLRVTDIGKMYTVDSLLYAGDLAGAISMNNSINGDSTYEDTKKAVNAIFLATFADGFFDLDSTQRADLLTIAEQNPLDLGKAVYEARAMLDTNFDDDISTSNLRLGKPEPEYKKLYVEGEKNHYKLYPNPNDGTMQLEYSIKDGQDGEFVLLDLTGRYINRYKLTSNNTILRISEQELKNAVYFYKIIVNGETVMTSKLVIIK